jgi:hypothetical protein
LRAAQTTQDFDGKTFLLLEFIVQISTSSDESAVTEKTACWCACPERKKWKQCFLNMTEDNERDYNAHNSMHTIPFINLRTFMRNPDNSRSISHGHAG